VLKKEASAAAVRKGRPDQREEKKTTRQRGEAHGGKRKKKRPNLADGRGEKKREQNKGGRKGRADGDGSKGLLSPYCRERANGAGIRRLKTREKKRKEIAIRPTSRKNRENLGEGGGLLELI